MEVRKGQIDAAVAYTYDRLSRDPVDFIIIQDEMEKAGVELILVSETLDSTDEGKLILHVRGYAAKVEAKKIAERTQRGLKQRAKAGKLPSGQRGRLYGYHYRDGVRVINEYQAAVVRNMFQWLLEGTSINEITYRLRAMDVPTPLSKPYWIRSTVYKILTNPAFMGKTLIYHGTMEIPGATPPIVSEDTFNQAQELLKQNKGKAGRMSKVRYLLRNRIVCSRCGRKYWGVAHSKTEDRHYYCKGRRSIITPIKCDNRGYKAEYIENIVWEKIEALLAKPEVILAGLETMQQEINDSGTFVNELEMINGQLANREKQRDRIYRSYYIAGDEAKFTKDITALDKEVKALSDRRAELLSRIENGKTLAVDVKRVSEYCNMVSGNISRFTFEDKQLALEALNIKVYIDGDNIDIQGAIPVDDILSTPAWPSGNR